MSQDDKDEITANIEAMIAKGMELLEEQQAAIEGRLEVLEQRRRLLQGHLDRLTAYREKEVEWVKDLEVVGRKALETIFAGIAYEGMSPELWSAQVLEVMLDMAPREARREEMVEIWLEVRLREAKRQRAMWEKREDILARTIRTKDWAQLVKEIDALRDYTWEDASRRWSQFLEDFSAILQVRERSGTPVP